MAKINPNTDLEREIALLNDLSHQNLGARWQAVHSAPPPKGISRRLLPIGYRWTLMAPLIPKPGAICARSRQAPRQLYGHGLP